MAAGDIDFMDKDNVLNLAKANYQRNLSIDGNKSTFRKVTCPHV